MGSSGLTTYIQNRHHHKTEADQQKNDCNYVFTFPLTETEWVLDCKSAKEKGDRESEGSNVVVIF